MQIWQHSKVDHILKLFSFSSSIPEPGVVLGTVDAGVQTIHLTRQGIRLKGADVWQKTCRKSFGPADRILPRSKFVELLNPDRGLDPVDGLSVADKVDIGVLLQDRVHPILQSIDVPAILVQPEKDKILSRNISISL